MVVWLIDGYIQDEEQESCFSIRSCTNGSMDFSESIFLLFGSDHRYVLLHWAVSWIISNSTCYISFIPASTAVVFDSSHPP
jgi:hypothetical protein